MENEALKAEQKHKTAVESAYDYIENFDILETITNVGNDEVFTPRKTCTMMLDILPEEVWHNPDYKWLNPASKNGIFEREIAIRLDKGLEKIIPNVEERRKHILQNMIYSIGLTKFTANVARRTLYYCSQANRKCDGIVAEDGHYVNGYAIGNGTWFDDEEGNVKTPNTDHYFEKKDNNCKFCRIIKTSKYLDANQIEKYAYEFIHIPAERLNEYIANRFFKGDTNMKFDVIVGNPPYHLNDGGGGSSSDPIYRFFVENAKKLSPKYISMIIPSRWFTGGKHLDKFRADMINDTRIRTLHDFINASDCFPSSVSIEGGVCFFLWDKEYNGKCKLINHEQNSNIKETERYLSDNEEIDVLIRDENVLRVLKRIMKNSKSYSTFNTIVSKRNPFKIGSINDSNYTQDISKSKYKILGWYDRKRQVKLLTSSFDLTKRTEWVDKWKIFISKADGAAGQLGNPIPARIIGKTEIGEPGTICTETFFLVGPFKNEEQMKNVKEYMKTKFFRFLVGTRKNKNMTSETYKFVPIVDFDKKWTDEELYDLFKLEKEDKDLIEKLVDVAE